MKCIIFSAFEHGINHFDTAPSYGTENTLGEILKLAESELGLTREDYSIQTKIDAWQMMERNIIKHVDDAMRKLRTDYLDSLLVHWPVPEEMNNTWSQMSGLKLSGCIKKIGICNVRMRQLNQIAGYDTKPDIVQIERNPLRICTNEIEFCKKNNIEIQAYSPLCKMNHMLRDNEDIKRIAEKYSRTEGQVIMRWHIDTGVVPIFATRKPERIEEYSQIFEFSLDPEDITAISSLNRNHKMYIESFACPGF